jgi:SAM-dependent methyltransferase
MRMCRAALAWLCGYDANRVNEFGDGFRALCLQVMRDRRVLDVGCGLGEHGDEVITFGSARRYFGLDRSPGLVTSAHAAHPAHAFCVGDGVAIPFRQGGVDVVSTSFTLHHIDPAAREVVMREMLRVAERHVIIRDLFGFNPGLRERLYRLYYTIVDGSYYRFSLDQWRAFFDRCGARIECEIHSPERELTHRLCAFVLVRRSVEPSGD